MKLWFVYQLIVLHLLCSHFIVLGKVTPQRLRGVPKTKPRKKQLVKNDKCQQSLRIIRGKTTKLNCYPNAATLKLVQDDIKKRYGDETVWPSYSWKMPSTLTPQNTQKDISLNGHGKLTISNPQPENSGMLTCSVIIAKDSTNPNSGKKTAFKHHVVVIEKPRTRYDLAFEFPFATCSKTLRRAKRTVTGKINRALCTKQKHCVGKVYKLFCSKPTVLRYEIRGPNRLAKQWTFRDEKEMRILFKRKLKRYSKVSKQRTPKDKVFKFVCPEGYSIDQFGVDCLPCRPGTFSKDGEKCVPCPALQWQDTYGSVSCFKCPKNSKLSYKGARRIEECRSTAKRNAMPAPESCDYVKKGTKYSLKANQIAKDDLETRNQMIASLESALSETASSDQKKLIEARIAELKREVEVIRKTWQLMDPHKMHQLKSQIVTMLNKVSALLEKTKNVNAQQHKAKLRKQIMSAMSVLYSADRMLEADAVYAKSERTIVGMVQKAQKSYDQAKNYAKQIPKEDKAGDWSKNTIEGAKWQTMQLMKKFYYLRAKITDERFALLDSSRKHLIQVLDKNKGMVQAFLTTRVSNKAFRQKNMKYETDKKLMPAEIAELKVRTYDKLKAEIDKQHAADVAKMKKAKKKPSKKEAKKEKKIVKKLKAKLDNLKAEIQEKEAVNKVVKEQKKQEKAIERKIKKKLAEKQHKKKAKLGINEVTGLEYSPNITGPNPDPDVRDKSNAKPVIIGAIAATIAIIIALCAIVFASTRNVSDNNTNNNENSDDVTTAGGDATDDVVMTATAAAPIVVGSRHSKHSRQALIGGSRSRTGSASRVSANQLSQSRGSFQGQQRRSSTAMSAFPQSRASVGATSGFGGDADDYAQTPANYDDGDLEPRNSVGGYMQPRESFTGGGGSGVSYAQGQVPSFVDDGYMQSRDSVNPSFMLSRGTLDGGYSEQGSGAAFDGGYSNYDDNFALSRSSFAVDSRPRVSATPSTAQAYLDRVPSLGDIDMEELMMSRGHMFEDY